MQSVIVIHAGTKATPDPDPSLLSASPCSLVVHAFTQVMVCWHTPGLAWMDSNAALRSGRLWTQSEKVPKSQQDCVQISITASTIQACKVPEMERDQTPVTTLCRHLESYTPMATYVEDWPLLLPSRVTGGRHSRGMCAFRHCQVEHVIGIVSRTQVNRRARPGPTHISLAPHAQGSRRRPAAGNTCRDVATSRNRTSASKGYLHHTPDWLLWQITADTASAPMWYK
jgi:hypothetical protein